MYIYIYIYVCLCVCVCVCDMWPHAKTRINNLLIGRPPTRHGCSMPCCKPRLPRVPYPPAGRGKAVARGRPP